MFTFIHPIVGADQGDIGAGFLNEAPSHPSQQHLIEESRVSKTQASFFLEDEHHGEILDYEH